MRKRETASTCLKAGGEENGEMRRMMQLMNDNFRISEIRRNRAMCRTKAGDEDPDEQASSADDAGYRL